jgi:hypothetical protein
MMSSLCTGVSHRPQATRVREHVRHRSRLRPRWMPRQLDHYPGHFQSIRRNHMGLAFPRQFDAVRLSIPSIAGPTNDGAFRAMSQAVLR